MRFNRALLLLPLLAACAAPEGEYPSLALRPAELATGAPEPTAPAPPPPTPAAVLSRLDQLTADAASAHRTFLAQAPALVRFILLVIPVEEHDLRVAFKLSSVRGEADLPRRLGWRGCGLVDR